MDELFELIKALSPSEKRYFKRFAKQHGESAPLKYIVLFDAYDALETYDAELLKRQIPDERILKYFNQEKKYLKDKLLDCLRVYRGPKTIHGKLLRLLEEHEILNELGLYKQGRKKLETAKRLSVQHDQFSILIQVLSFERKNLIENNLNRSPRARSLEWDRIDKELQNAVKAQEIIAQYHKIYLSLLAIYRRYNQINEDRHLDQKRLNELRESPLLKNSELPEYFYAKHLYFLSLSTLSQLEGRYNDAEQLYESLISMWDERPDRIVMQQRRYMLVLCNYLNVLHKIGRYDQFEKTMNQIRAFRIDHYDDQAERFQNLAHLDLLYFMNHGVCKSDAEVKRLFAEIPQRIEKGLIKFSSKINPARRLVLYFNLMMLSFIAMDISRATYWLIKIDQSEYARKVRKEILDFCKVIQLIFFFEKEEFGLISSFYRNNKRFLYREERLNDFYLISMDALHKLSGTTGKEASQEILRSLQAKLRKELKTTGLPNIVGAQEVLLWIRHRLEKKSLLQVLREEAVAKSKV